MSIPATIRAMQKAGADSDLIIETVLEMAEEALANKRRRQANYLINKKSRDVTPVTDVTGKVSPTPPSKKILPPSDIPLRGDISSPPPAKPTPKTELLRVLDQEHAQAVVEHRQLLRKPLTPRAAKMLANSLSDCPDANDAADTMIERGWLSVKPEWLANAGGNGRAPPNPLKDAFAQTRRDLGISDEPANQTIDLTADA